MCLPFTLPERKIDFMLKPGLIQTTGFSVQFFKQGILRTRPLHLTPFVIFKFLLNEMYHC